MRHMKKTGISHDTWGKEAVQKPQPLKSRASVNEGFHSILFQQEYQRAHARRYSALLQTVSNATIVSVTADPEWVLLLSGEHV